MVNNEIDHKTDLVGKYFVDGIIKLGCNILNGITPSSELSFSDNTIYDEFAISAIISKYQSWLIDDYEDDVLNTKSIDYNSIIDKMNVNMDNDVQLSHANVKIPLGCKFLNAYFNQYFHMFLQSYNKGNQYRLLHRPCPYGKQWQQNQQYRSGRSNSSN